MLVSIWLSFMLYSTPCSTAVLLYVLRCYFFLFHCYEFFLNFWFLSLHFETPFRKRYCFIKAGSWTVVFYMSISFAFSWQNSPDECFHLFLLPFYSFSIFLLILVRVLSSQREYAETICRCFSSDKWAFGIHVRRSQWDPMWKHCPWLTMKHTTVGISI